jgi:hypothetical protein
MTTEVAMLVTYLLGSLATLDHMVLAAALGVVVAALLTVSRAVCPVVAADLALLVSVRLQQAEAVSTMAQPLRAAPRRS